MFGSLVGSLVNTQDATKSKIIMYMVIAIAVIVIIGVLLDGVRRFIRGLDTAVLGGIFLWIAYKSWNIPVISALAEYLLAAGATLVAVGLIVFIINRIVRRKRNVRIAVAEQKAQAEKHLKQEQKKQAQEAEQTGNQTQE